MWALVEFDNFYGNEIHFGKFIFPQLFKFCFHVIFKSKDCNFDWSKIGKMWQKVVWILILKRNYLHLRNYTKNTRFSTLWAIYLIYYYLPQKPSNWRPINIALILRVLLFLKKSAYSANHHFPPLVYRSIESRFSTLLYLLPLLPDYSMEQKDDIRILLLTTK